MRRVLKTDIEVSTYLGRSRVLDLPIVATSGALTLIVRVLMFHPGSRGVQDLGAELAW